MDEDDVLGTTVGSTLKLATRIRCGWHGDATRGDDDAAADDDVGGAVGGVAACAANISVRTWRAEGCCAGGVGFGCMRMMMRALLKRSCVYVRVCVCVCM